MQAYYPHFLTIIYTFFEQFSEHLRPKLDNALYGGIRFGYLTGMG